MKKALITGITGQDGSCLAGLIPEKSYERPDIKRRTSPCNTGRIDRLYQDPYKAGRLHLLEHVHSGRRPSDPINIGRETDATVREQTGQMQQATGKTGKLTWDDSKPNGAPRKVMDVSRMKNPGWSIDVDLNNGLDSTYNWHRNRIKPFDQATIPTTGIAQ